MDVTEGQQIEYRGYLLTELTQRFPANEETAVRTVWRITVSRDGVDHIVGTARTLEAANRKVDEIIGS